MGWLRIRSVLLVWYCNDFVIVRKEVLSAILFVPCHGPATFSLSLCLRSTNVSLGAMPVHFTSRPRSDSHDSLPHSSTAPSRRGLERINGFKLVHHTDRIQFFINISLWYNILIAAVIFWIKATNSAYRIRFIYSFAFVYTPYTDLYGPIHTYTVYNIKYMYFVYLVRITPLIHSDNIFNLSRFTFH